MLIKRILGFLFLTIFIGFMAMKLANTIGDQDDAPLLTFLIVVILLIIGFAIRRILVDY